MSTGAGLLLADEPTSQLGHADRDTMVDLIQRVNAEFGTTVVIVTHDPDIAAQIPRRITIRNGRIGSEGVHGRDYAVIDQDGAVHLPEESPRRTRPGSLVEFEETEDGFCSGRVDEQAGARVRVLLAGLWTRRGMNATSLLVSVLAIVAAVLGPMYARASAEHLLDTRLDERAPYTTGLTYSVPAQDGTDVPRDDPAAFRAPAVADLVRTRVRAVPRPLRRPLLAGRDRLGAGPGRAVRPRAAAVRRTDLLARGHVPARRGAGRCPTAAGEALMQATMARTLGLSAGDTFDVDYSDTYLRRQAGAPRGVEAQRSRTVSYRIVGTYRVTDPASPASFDLSRFTGLDDLVVPPQRGTGAAPTAPALLVAPASMTSQTFRDRPRTARRHRSGRPRHDGPRPSRPPGTSRAPRSTPPPARRPTCWPTSTWPRCSTRCAPSAPRCPG